MAAAVMQLPHRSAPLWALDAWLDGYVHIPARTCWRHSTLVAVGDVA